MNKIFNTRRSRPKSYDSQTMHRSYGIQRWLVYNKYCLKQDSKYKVDAIAYEALLKEFCLPLIDNVNTIQGYEKFIQDARFVDFANFCHTKYGNTQILRMRKDYQGTRNDENQNS